MKIHKFIEQIRSVRLCAIVACTMIVNIANADNDKTMPDTMPDTIHVEEVVVSSKNIHRYQVGVKIERVSPKQFENLQTGTLDKMLARTSPISMKGNAGGLTTIRMRGTSPDHTSINFGSININSLTLGHSNVSNVPMYLFDDLIVQYGGASAMYGSGSIGGAIHLGMNSHWVEGVRTEARVSHGSFGEQMYGAKLWLGNGNFEAVTRGYYYYKKNDFSFINPFYRDFENEIFEIDDVQQNADIENMGVIQEFNYKFKTGHTLKTKFWIERDWHLIQQSMGTNISNPDARETYEDKHVRAWLDYDNKLHPVKFHLGAGYVYDIGIFNETPDPVKTQRVLLEGNASRQLWQGASIKSGIDYKRIIPDVYAYSEELDHEDRLDLFLLFRQDLLNKFQTTINVRKGYVTGFDNVPFTPAFGLSYMPYRSESTMLKFMGNISRSYRVPTFNDRYWEPGGNPDILPEDGMNYEIGANLTRVSELSTLKVKVNAFYMDVENWVLWVNGGSFWYADNVDQVVSKGVELKINYDRTIGKTRLTSGVMFSYNQAERETGDIAGRQLEYVPLYMGSGFTSLSFRSWTIGLDGKYTPWQYTDGTYENTIDAFFLLNSSIDYKLRFKNGHQLKVVALLNNLTNKNYQSEFGYAMPRFNYNLSLTYTIN